MAEPHDSLLTGLANLLRTGEFSDLKILCGDLEFKVHKNVILCQSRPIMAMCTNGMKETQENVIDLTVDTEPCVSRLIDFLYRCDYDALEHESGHASMNDSDTNNDNVDLEGATNELTVARDPSDNASIKSDFEANQKAWMSTTPRQLSLHLDMYVLADKYDIASLGDLAKKKFEEEAKSYIPFFSEFPVLDMIPRIYAVTGEHNRALRDVVVEYARLQRTKPNYRDSWTTPIAITDLFRNRIESLFESVPEFAIDISRSWLKTPYLGYCKGDYGNILCETKVTCAWCGNL